MAIDQPVIVYRKEKKGGHASKAEMDEITEAWERKHRQSRAGRRISLNEYFNNGVTDEDKG